MGCNHISHLSTAVKLSYMYRHCDQHPPTRSPSFTMLTRVCSSLETLGVYIPVEMSTHADRQLLRKANWESDPQKLAVARERHASLAIACSVMCAPSTDVLPQ